MNIPDSVGESSSKRQENGDGPTGSERPLKKARFAWQVKGKYHLKNDNNETSQTSTCLNREAEAAGPSSETESVSGNLVESAEQNLEILGDYLLKQDFNTLDSVIAGSEKSLLTPSTSISTESLPYPQYIGTNSNNPFTRRDSFSSSDLVAIPYSMVVSRTSLEDQCIARWQARQMAKGFVDNTINRVLDSWSRPLPVPNVDESRFVALDIAEFINNMPGDNSVENEGILMAISAHGLQNTSTSNASSTSEQPDHSSVDQEVQMTPALKEEHFTTPPSSPMPSERMEPFIRRQKDSNRCSTPDSAWVFPKEVGSENNDLSSFSIYNPSNPCEYFNENDQSLPGIEYNDAENLLENHYDFMDAAVSFAILNKGLTTFGSEYG